MPLSSLANAAAELKAEEVRRRLEARPNDVDALNDWGVVLAREKRVEDAILQFQKALRLDPSRTMVLGNLAMAYGQADRLDNAESCLTRLAQLKPDAPTVFIDWGRVLRKLRRYVESLDAFAKAMSLSAQPADVHVEIGATYVEMLRNDDAKQSFQKAIDAKPDHAQAHSNLGILLKEAGEYEKAIDHLRHAVRARPTCASDWNNLGVALAETRQHEEAVVHYHKALSIDPNYTVSWNNLGNALRTLGRSQEAIAALQKALELKSDYAEAMNNIAIAHLQCGDSLRALYFYNKAIRLKPDYAEARMNRALAWLGLGEFEKGWTEYEWRWNLKHLAKRRLPGRRWDGSPLQGKRLLIRYEQGLGDTFQFIRYAPWLKQRGAFVIFEGQPSAREILSRTPGIDQFVTRGDKVSGIDFFTTLLSLPGLFQTRLETIPAPIPYIHPDPAMAQAWKARLESLHGFKVGIAWQGNPQHRGDRQRSVPLEQFKILSQIEGVKLVSLQRGAGCEQIEKLKNEIDLETFQGVEEEADGLLRTAAIIKNLDLLITIDTAVAHLAGAMGVPVWVALPLAADWRWLRDREDSPWYPQMRLFRQQWSGEWTGVFGRIAQSLREKMADKAPVDTAAAIPRDCQRADELLQEGNKQIGEGRIAAAQESFKQALLLDSLNPSIHHDLGVSFAKQGMLPRAIACFRRSLELAPQNANAYANLGLAFLHNEQIDEAVAHLQKAIFLGGGSADVHNNLGVALMQVPDPVAAAESYRRALYLKPDYAAAHYNLARALLIQGDFVQGWLEYEWRYDFAGKPDRHELDRRWAGQRIDGKTLLLHAEQEIEDVIQFARYIPHIKRRGPTRIVLACPAPLVMLMHGCSGLDQVFVSGGSLPHFDLQARLMSLPGILETTLETIPTPIPYIHPDPAMAQAWKARLESLHGFKVGIAWQGNPQHRGDRQRSVPLEQFKILSQIEGVKLVSLQRGAGCEQIEKLKNEIDLETFQGVEEEADGLLRTAAIIKNLDLLITIDTAVAHLAGAMGVPAWVALPLAADWRWLRDREDSPWYPHMRLFRQHRRNDWTSVFEAIALELQKTAPAPSPPMPRRKTDETVPRLAPTAPPAPEAATSVQSTVQSILPVRRMLQSQFDVGVVMTTIMRPTLKRAVQSIFAQRFLGRIQILLGIDKCKGDMAVLNELQQACPQNCALTVLDLGYSTAARNGGLYPSMPGGALRTILSYAANCRRLAYLDDDNWYAESHLQSLSDSLDRNDWAYSLRWYVDRETQQPLCIDRWESVGPGRGVYATNLGGYVDPNCLMIDKIVCESVLRWWCFPVPADRSARSEDRQVFRLLKERSRVSSTGQATVYYTIHPSDALHAHRTRWISETVHEPLTDDAKPAEAAR